MDVVPAVVFIGLGAGLSFPSLMTLAMSGATPSDAGLASGLVNATVQVGGAVGLAVLATLATERTAGQLAAGESLASAPELGLSPRLPDRRRARGRSVRHGRGRASLGFAPEAEDMGAMPAGTEPAYAEAA